MYLIYIYNIIHLHAQKKNKKWGRIDEEEEEKEEKKELILIR